MQNFTNRGSFETWKKIGTIQKMGKSGFFRFKFVDGKFFNAVSLSCIKIIMIFRHCGDFETGKDRKTKGNERRNRRFF